MMPAIRVDNLSKLYRLGPQSGASYRTLRDTIAETVTDVWRRWRHGPTATNGEELWAVRDLSFAVEPGQVVGIVGRNGAGKSTLLKILSRIPEPTSGRVELRGRVGSLLEVGTGFHPELTGRENVYLSGAILGMGRREIARKFDAIVEFAGVERFLGTPVKRYSSGMYVRLAFAVAAHLEPEVLLVDEALAVGDAEFQRRCLGKMEDIAHQGRTVFFVSHQMAAVQRLCTHAIFLEKGRLIAQGPKGPVIEQYLAGSAAARQSGEWIDLAAAERRGTGEARFTAARFRCPDAVRAGNPYPDGPLACDLVIASDRARSVPSLGLTVCDVHGTKLVNADTVIRGQSAPLRAGDNEVRLRIDRLHLNPGTYQVSLWLADNPHHVHDYVPCAWKFEVTDAAEEEGFGQRPVGDGLVSCAFAVDFTASGKA